LGKTQRAMFDFPMPTPLKTSRRVLIESKNIWILSVNYCPLSGEKSQKPSDPSDSHLNNLDGLVKSPNRTFFEIIKDWAKGDVFPRSQSEK
jgi:hypothetical protein